MWELNNQTHNFKEKLEVVKDCLTLGVSNTVLRLSRQLPAPAALCQGEEPDVARHTMVYDVVPITS